LIAAWITLLMCGIAMIMILTAPHA
jgi:hypothetical protein